MKRAKLRQGAVLILAAEKNTDDSAPITRWTERAIYVLCHSNDIEARIAKLWADGYHDIRLFDEVDLRVESKLTITIKEK